MTNTPAPRPDYSLVPASGRAQVPRAAVAALRSAGVSNVLTSFLDGYASDASRASMRRVARAVARDLLYFPTPPEKLEPEDAPWLLLARADAPAALQRYHEHLRKQIELREATRDADPDKGESPQGLSVATANQRLALLRGLVKELAFHGALERSDLERLLDQRRGLSTFKNEGGQKQPTVSDKEWARLEVYTEDLLEEAPNRARRDRAMLALTLSSGMRRDEAARAKWGDLQVEGTLTTIRVRGKGRRVDTVPVPPGAARVLEEWRAACGSPQRGPILLATTPGDQIIKGEHMTPDGLYRRFRTLCKKAGIDERGMHALRRAFVTTLLEKNLDLSTVRDLARHSDVTTTARYDRRDAKSTLRKGGEAAPDPFQGEAA